MKTFKNCGLALAIAAALVMTATSCSSENDLTETPNVEQPTQPTTDGVKITVSAGISDDATTRSEVATEDGKRVLKFTTGDQLYVYGEIDASTSVAGYLTMDGAPTNSNKTATFTGTVKAYDISDVTPIETTMPAGNDPLALCTYKTAKATLVHKDLNTDAIHITLGKDAELYTDYMFATDVEMLMTKSLPVQGDYASGTMSFALSCDRPIFNCTLTGLTPGTKYDIGLFYETPSVWLQSFWYDGFTADANGAINVAFVSQHSGTENWKISVGFPLDHYDIDLGTKDLSAKVYNVTRHWTGNCFAKLVSGSVSLASVTDNIVALDGATLTGAMTGYTLFIADGAKVTLSGASVTAATGRYNGAIRCLGDATIILADGTENVAMSSNNNYYSAVHWPADKKLTITGSTDATAGKLTSDSRAGGGTGGLAGIGGGTYHPCGDIEIKGGDITAYGEGYGAGIGACEEGHCGNITISGGTVTATGEGSGAGIGAGGGSSGASCGKIKISGGTVTAKGGSDSGGAAGIGHGTINNSAASVTITGDITSVTATRGSQGSGVRCIGDRKNGSATIDGKKIDSQYFEDSYNVEDFPTFPNLNFAERDNYKDARTWTLTLK